MTSPQKLSSSLIESFAGFVAGIASTFVGHPFDVIKTRLQVNRSSSPHVSNSFQIFKELVYSKESRFTGLYRGLSPNLVGNSVSWALYFVWYDNIKTRLRAYHGHSSELVSYDFFLASGAAGTITAICTNPIWVIKTRMLSTSSKYPGAYSSIADGTRQILLNEGFRGFYHGLVPSLFGVSHGALQFMAYEKLKIHRSKAGPVKGELGTLDLLIVSGLAKIFAGSITYPYQVVRSRLQMYDAEKMYNGMRDVMTQIWRREGARGYYKGLGPNLLRVMPSTCVTFLVYEKTKLILPRLCKTPENK